MDPIPSSSLTSRGGRLAKLRSSFARLRAIVIAAWTRVRQQVGGLLVRLRRLREASEPLQNGPRHGVQIRIGGREFNCAFDFAERFSQARSRSQRPGDAIPRARRLRIDGQRAAGVLTVGFVEEPRGPQRIARQRERFGVAACVDRIDAARRATVNSPMRNAASTVPFRAPSATEASAIRTPERIPECVRILAILVKACCVLELFCQIGRRLRGQQRDRGDAGTGENDPRDVPTTCLCFVTFVVWCDRRVLRG